MRFAICNEIFGDWKIEEAFACAARLGYDAVEIAPYTLAERVSEISATERRRLRDCAAHNGLVLCGIHWVLMKTTGMHLTHGDPSVRRRTSEYLCELVDFCADLGGGIVVVGSPRQRNLLPGVSPAQAWDAARETFRDSVKRAEDRAVTLCLEPLAPAETDFINGAAEALRFTKELASPSFKIVLDVKAMCSEAKSIPEIIRESSPHFAHFHANDRNLKGPGFGDVDFKPIAAALKEVGYKGFVSVEVFRFEEGPEIIAGKSIEYLKRNF